MTKYYGNFKKWVWNFVSPPIQCWEPIALIDTSFVHWEPITLLDPSFAQWQPITLLDARFAHCSSTWLRRGRGEKHKIVQIAVYPIIFVTDCSLCSLFITSLHAGLQLINMTTANLPYWPLVPNVSHLSLHKLCFLKKLTASTINCMTKVPNIFAPLSNFWQYPNMAQWHVIVYIMFVYCTFMKVCMQKKKKEKEFAEPIVKYITSLLW